MELKEVNVSEDIFIEICYSRRRAVAGDFPDIKKDDFIIFKSNGKRTSVVAKVTLIDKVMCSQILNFVLYGPEGVSNG